MDKKTNGMSLPDEQAAQVTGGAGGNDSIVDFLNAAKERAIKEAQSGGDPDRPDSVVPRFDGALDPLSGGGFDPLSGSVPSPNKLSIDPLLPQTQP